MQLQSQGLDKVQTWEYSEIFLKIHTACNMYVVHEDTKGNSENEATTTMLHCVLRLMSSDGFPLQLVLCVKAK